FTVGHPQRSTHVLQKRKFEHIPVFSGSPIPRQDVEDQAEKYVIVMLALFRPWNRSTSNPLKLETTAWSDALIELLSSLPKAKLTIIDHMQEQWECRLAAEDYSAQYK
ncbi:hypothetical protein B0H15DRAFT_765006, partial [Mycena belliarum]